MSDRESYTVVNLNAEKPEIDYFFLDRQTVDTVVDGSQMYNGDGNLDKPRCKMFSTVTVV